MSMVEKVCFIYWTYGGESLLHILDVWWRKSASYIRCMVEKVCFIYWTYGGESLLHILDVWWRKSASYIARMIDRANSLEIVVLVAHNHVHVNLQRTWRTYILLLNMVQ